MKKKKNQNWFKKNYSESFDFVKDSMRFVYLIVGVFLFMGIFGFFVSPPSEIAEMILNLLQELLAQTEGLDFLGFFRFIFLNNLKSSFLGLFVGVLFGIFPLFSAIGNGYLLGFVGRISVSSEGVFSLWKILPHGIFELPAVFISLGLGLRLGFAVFNEKERKNFKILLRKSLFVFLLWVFPLLVVAAFIESFLIVFL